MNKCVNYLLFSIETLLREQHAEFEQHSFYSLRVYFMRSNITEMLFYFPLTLLESQVVV